MNTTLATSNINSTRTRRSTTQSPISTRSPAPGVGRAGGSPESFDRRPASEITRLVFCVILAISACVALIGVLDQASSTSPDAPAPEVIVDLD